MHGLTNCTIYAMAVICLLLLSACGANGTGAVTPDAGSTPQTALAPTLGLTQRLQREAQLGDLRVAQAQIEAVWRDLSEGRAVSCATELEQRPSPSIFDDSDDAVATALYQSSMALERAVQLWQVECNNPRTVPSGDIVSRGLGAALEAKIALEDAQDLLLGTQNFQDN